MNRTRITRRAAVLLGSAIPLALAAGALGNAASFGPITDLERECGGRLGVFILDTATGKSAGHRADERFGMCSTFKLLVAAAVMQAAEQGRFSLDDVIAFSQADIVPVAPVTSKNLDKGGMNIRDLAEAAQKFSDNVAANLLIKRLGGPHETTKLFRRWGDAVTRLDHYEPELNRVLDGEQENTTTPRAIAQTTQKILTTNILSPTSRDTLIQWMVDTKLGAKRIRAGLPANWKSGDRTGAGISKGMMNKCNDVAVAFPPGRKPLIITGYLEANYEGPEMRDEDQAVLAEVGRIATKWYSNL